MLLSLSEPSSRFLSSLVASLSPFSISLMCIESKGIAKGMAVDVAEN